MDVDVGHATEGDTIVIVPFFMNVDRDFGPIIAEYPMDRGHTLGGGRVTLGGFVVEPQPLRPASARRSPPTTPQLSRRSRPTFLHECRLHDRGDRHDALEDREPLVRQPVEVLRGQRHSAGQGDD